MATEAYTPEEVAARIRCKPSWLKAKAERREIPFSMIAGAYRFTDDHIAWILDRFEETPRPSGTVAPGPVRQKKMPPPKAAATGRKLNPHPSPKLRAAGY